MIKLKYTGKINSPTMEQPGWAGENGEEDFQPWQSPYYKDACLLGIDLLFAGEDALLEKPFSSPFVDLGNDLYSLDTDVVVQTPTNCSLLIMPHMGYFTEPQAYPLIVPSVVQADWWLDGIKLLCRFVGPVSFIHNKPIAKLVCIPKQSVIAAEFDNEDIARMAEQKKWRENEGRKYITRDRNINGYQIDNLYEVLCGLDKRGNMPREIKKEIKHINFTPRVVKKNEIISHQKTSHDERKD